MNKINWREVARQYNLTVDQFKDQLFTTAAAMGAMEIDQYDFEQTGQFKFTCSDEIGEIELYVKRNT